MGVLAANPIPAVVLLLSLLTATPPISAKLKTFTITYDGFNSNIQKLHFASSESTIADGALQVTLATENTQPQTGRILYRKPFKLWEGGIQSYSDRVASFNTSFLVNLNLNPKIGFPTPGEGVAFVAAPNLTVSPDSWGQFLGQTTHTTDGDISNQIVAVELDTLKGSVQLPGMLYRKAILRKS